MKLYKIRESIPAREGLRPWTLQETSGVIHQRVNSSKRRIKTWNLALSLMCDNIRESIPAREGLRPLSGLMVSKFLTIIRESIPAREGLRPLVNVMNISYYSNQRVNSSIRRIKTLYPLNCQPNPSLIRESIPASEGLRQVCYCHCVTIRFLSESQFQHQKD